MGIKHPQTPTFANLYIAASMCSIYARAVLYVACTPADTSTYAFVYQKTYACNCTCANLCMAFRKYVRVASQIHTHGMVAYVGPVVYFWMYPHECLRMLIHTMYTSDCTHPAEAMHRRVRVDAYTSRCTHAHNTQACASVGGFINTFLHMRGQLYAGLHVYRCVW